LLAFSLLAACQEEGAPTPASVAVVGQEAADRAVVTEEATPREPTVPLTPTAVPPTPTPSEPLAALVNDQPIYFSTYEKELARYEQAQAELGLTQSAAEVDYRTQVLNALIERALIAQAAQTRGIEVTPDMVDQKLAQLRQAAGDSGNFEAWLEANQWTEEEFREALAAEMLVEEMVDAVTADVPYAVEQVRARYIQVDDVELAQTLLERVGNGDSFSSLAEQYSLDQVTAQNGGDLGYFARGSLLVPEVEEVAFSLQPGEVSEIITASSDGGGQTVYYLVQTVERDPSRPLTADLRYNLLQEEFEAWLDAQWGQADVVRLVDEGA
jgi:parvulin-like peptidyl-prolyl isomerase